MSEDVTFDAEDIEFIDDFKRDYFTLTSQYGEIVFNIRQLEVEKNRLESEFDTIAQRRNDLVDRIFSKYGAGELDIRNNQWVPAKQTS